MKKYLPVIRAITLSAFVGQLALYILALMHYMSRHALIDGISGYSTDVVALLFTVFTWIVIERYRQTPRRALIALSIAVPLFVVLVVYLNIIVLGM